MNLSGQQATRKVPDQLLPFISKETIVVRAPGRINLIGEHTDYNDGFVLPAAIDKAAYLAVNPLEDNVIRLHALDLGETYETSIAEMHKSGRNWPAYILGVVDQFQKKKVAARGFEAALVADVPIGAGLSSSAAVENATALALNVLLRTSFDKQTLVKMSQLAEHEYAGVQCGIMDQFASMFGKKDHAIRLDCRSLDYEYIPVKLDQVKIVLFDSDVKHSLASTEYNTRRQQCETGIAILQRHGSTIASLRDATADVLERYIAPENPLVYRRCKYVVEENDRVLQACNDLKSGDIAAFGKKMFLTHEGLSSLYEVSCTELDLLVNLVKDNPDVIGARMMGGGFGGCTINLVKEAAIPGLVERVSAAYYAQTKKECKTYIAEIENGAALI